MQTQKLINRNNDDTVGWKGGERGRDHKWVKNKLENCITNDIKSNQLDVMDPPSVLKTHTRRWRIKYDYLLYVLYVCMCKAVQII